MKNLTELGDRYYQKDDYRAGRGILPEDRWAFPPRTPGRSTTSWKRSPGAAGACLWNFANVWRQFRLLTRGFNSSLLLLSGFFSVLMFSGLLLFFLVAAALVIRYFKLAAHDFILGGNSRFRIQQAAPAAAAPAVAAGHHRRLGILPVPALRLALELFQPRRPGQHQAHPGHPPGAGAPVQPGEYLEKSMQSPGFQNDQKDLCRPPFPGKHLPAASTTR